MAMKIIDIMPNCSLSTDIIVGFPGETDVQLRETLDLMDSIKFNSAFTFKYSPRTYTKAEQFSDQIDESVKKEELFCFFYFSAFDPFLNFLLFSSLLFFSDFRIFFAFDTLNSSLACSVFFVRRAALLVC